MKSFDHLLNQLIIKPHIRLIFAIGFILFIGNKFAFRPWVLVQNSVPILKIITWSLPNFIEAVLGSIVGTALFSLQVKYPSFLTPLKDQHIYLIAISLAGIYVLTQEVKWHSLGGRNIYDPNDFVASILGLLFIFGVLYQYGFREK